MLVTSQSPLALIGAGQMGLALAQGWLKNVLEPGALVVLDRRPEMRGDFYAHYGCAHVQSMQELAAFKPSALCLAVKPQQLEALLAQINEVFAPGKPLIMSVIAGKACSDYQNALWDNAAIIRMMPNTPSRIGRGMTGCFAGASVSDVHRRVCETLMHATGQMLWLEDEAMMHALTAISGSGPAYVFYLIECFIRAAQKHGFDEKAARLLAAQTFTGASQMALESREEISALREHVTSPNGTTQAGLTVLMGETLESLIEHTVTAAASRSETLMHS